MGITKRADTISEAAAIAKAAEEAAERAANNDEEDEDEDDDEENKSKVVFRPIFQMACNELMLLSQLRPHDSNFLLEQLSHNISFLCSEIPLVSTILMHEHSNADFYNELYRQAQEFMAQAFDKSFTALYEYETNKSISDLKRDMLWLSSVKTIKHCPPPVQEDSSVLLYVDLDVAHCFTVRALDGIEANTGDATPIQTEWNWIDGIDTFTPKKIVKATELIQELHQVHKQAYTGEKDLTVTVIILSRMSKPRVVKDKSKKKKKQPVLPLPEDAMPSMVYVSQKLQETLGLPVEFIPCLDTLHERLDKSHAIPTPSPIPTPNPIHGDQPALSTEVVVKTPSFDFRILVMEHWEQLLHPKPRVEPVVVEEVKVVKDDPKAKPAKKKGKEKEEEEKKSTTPAVVVEKKELPHYDTLEAKLDAVWHNSYCDMISDRFNMFIDVVVLDTFGAEDWQSIVAITPKKTRIVGPLLATELNRLKPILQPQDLWSYRIRPNNSRLAALVGGKSLTSKVWMFDNLLEISDDIYLTGSVACTFLRYLTLPKAQRKLFDQDGECGLTFRVMERLQSKAQRLQVKIYLPMDYIVGDGPIVPEDDEKPTDEGENLSPQAAEEEDEDDEEDGDDEDEEEEEPVAKKKKKKVVKVVGMYKYVMLAYQNEFVETIIVTEPEELYEICISTPYEGSTFTVQHKKISSESAWIAIDEIKPGALYGDFEVVNQTGNPIPLPHHWINRVYDIGVNALNHLTKRISVQGDPVIIAGVPGIIECRDFQTSSKGIIAALQGKDDVVIVGGATTKWIQHLEEGSPNKVVQSRLNSSVLKYLVAGKEHPALSSIMH
ncbi:hypothetical protein THRCLA_07258 [Thraustotheca clavata]|uniref:phosphoglycerate kinase n=1 Tax=Thraustotheca clavata TaxID=74557 RepID=A0A1V9ZET8_9STRA|nr:hypothetical protein THRCLA_07258 [Thraustotheca clavata]